MTLIIILGFIALLLVYGFFMSYPPPEPFPWVIETRYEMDNRNWSQIFNGPGSMIEYTGSTPLWIQHERTHALLINTPSFFRTDSRSKTEV